MHPAKRIIQEIARANRASIEEAGDFDPGTIAAILERGLASSPNRHQLMLGIAEFLARSLEGEVPDPELWVPLQHLPAEN
jgi:hypothetical protein